MAKPCHGVSGRQAGGDHGFPLRVGLVLRALTGDVCLLAGRGP